MRLTGNTAIQEFLRGIVVDQTEYESALLKIKAEAEAQDLIRPEAIPKDAMVIIYMCEQTNIDKCGNLEEVAELPYDRSLTLRSLGNGRFKVLSEDFGRNYEPVRDERFGTNDIVEIGTSIVNNDNKRDLESVCRFQEQLAVRCNKKVDFLDVKESDDEPKHIIVYDIYLDGKTVLPL